ncbi:venom allergen 5.02-like [Diorhabda carinulata]|uniref:venom allergen 5.02-like n=1 Tax=Diorhabda carinulata TaxID=1163345 RepID=UPI0025A111A1|nr:venom allergen 5.02-like [Diorhabda carinulata]
MLLIQLVTASCLFFHVILAAVDYCQLSCGDEVNTACSGAPWKCGRRENCKKMCTEDGLTKEEKHTILHLHNYYRNEIATGREKRGNQPKAADMMELTYDDDLEYLAQCSTNRCKYEHDTCRKTEKYSSVGQNIGLHSTNADSSNRTLIIVNLVRRWYDEVTDVKREDIENFGLSDRTESIAHYTQLVWSETKQVGCGLTMNEEDNIYNFYLACNYGPMGNVLNGSVYKIGNTRSQCSTDSGHNDWSGLC